MAPTRRKPTKRKIKEESIGAPAGALSVDELRENEAESAASFVAGTSGARDFASNGFAEKAARPRVIREEAPGDEGFDGEDLGDEDRAESPRKPRRLTRFHIVLIVILAVLIAIEGGFCLLRWTPDDAADMQGTWYVNESDKTISITDEVIVLAEDVAYGYEIDEAAKTITYEFGIMEGCGRYRFSLDRTQLAIVDGEFTFWETLTSDISWTFEALLAQLFGDPLAPGKGEMVALLTRAPFEEGAPLPSDPAGEGDAPVEGSPEGEGGSGAGELQEGASAGQEGESQQGGSQQGETSGEGSGSAQEGSSRNDKLTVVDKLVVSDKPMGA
ncbi:MAG: hypothetical protein IKV48_08220 [Eggerthellaceae bacterium]|nr:hypothetical protein [Eggerthellaceae bacterium]